MSVTIYMTVTVENEQVTPNVHVTSIHSPLWASGGAPPDTPMEDVRFGVKVATEVLDFAERIKRGSSP